MTQEDKRLLLQDLCARLPYDIIVKCYFVDGGGEEVLDTNDIGDLLYNEENSEFPMYIPYLRPMSSMTEEEKKQYDVFCLSPYLGIDEETASNFIDWLNARHFDYRGLIEKGLAIAVTKENNPYESNM